MGSPELQRALKVTADRPWSRLRAASGATASNGLRKERLSPPTRREIILALFLLLCYGFFRQGQGWNEYSRFDLVRAIVDERTVKIDAYHRNTGDKAFYNGHYYSSKLPGSSLLGAPVYAVLRGVAHLTSAERPDDGTVIHALAFATAGVPTVVLALLLLRFLRSAVPEAWALAVTAGYALGTLAFPFATMYFGHAASSCFLFAAFYLLWRSRTETRAWRALAAGALAGCAALTELPTALGGAVLLGYALWLSRRNALLFLAGGLPALAVLLGYNWIAFDHPLRLGYQYSVNFGESHREGVVGVSLPLLSVGADLLYGPRGLLRLSPWLGLAPLGLWALRRRRRRPELFVAATMVAAFLVYNSGFFNPFGGASPGPRYLTPALPFAALLVAFAPRRGRALAPFLIAVSIALVFVATATRPASPIGVRNPIQDDWLPRFLSRNLAETTPWLHWGLPGAQPLLVLGLAALVALGALGATTRHTPTTDRMFRAGIGLLAILTVSFGALPAPWPAVPVTAADGTAVRLAIVDAGVTVMHGKDERLVARPWVQIENRGGQLSDIQVDVAIRDSSGQRVWRTSSRTGRWRAGQRRSLEVEWSPNHSPPGKYRFDVALTSNDRRETYARFDGVEFRYVDF